LGGLDQLTKALANKPDAIFIEFTMNDAVARFGISEQMSKDNLQTMINRINTWAAEEHKSVDIVIQTMNNEGGGATGARPNLPSYNQGYRDAAKSNDLLLIDNYPKWENLLSTDLSLWRTYVPDGVHPTELGTTAIIMPTVKQALLSQVPEPRTIDMVIIGSIFSGLAFLTTCIRSAR
jgi:acyl-CoA thioesterase-1